MTTPARTTPASTPRPDDPPGTGLPWWRDAVFYQVYPRSFADSNGDGVGDLDGIRAHLGYLELLGVDAIWLSPVMRSPMIDHGYDVSDPRDIDPLFGDLAAFDALVADAHSRGIRIVMDVVPNHTSSEHPWFRRALRSAPGGRERARYHFRDGRGPHGDEPPNNWPSIFGGPAWTRITEPDGSPGQWYLHVFAPEQPDLNWANDEVAADLDATLRFWLARGVDGFRIDVAHGMAKPDGLPDHDRWAEAAAPDDDPAAPHADDPRFDDPAVHAVHRRIRRVLDGHPGTVAIGEIWLGDHHRFAQYLRPDELHLGFAFGLTRAAWSADAIRAAVDAELDAVRAVGAPPTWALSNHDVSREVTRYGGGRVGLDRARAMALVVLALPGAVFVYNGAELGLPDVELPDEALQDPVWERSGHTRRGRDGCRVPMPWEGTAPPFGFGAAHRTWLPQPPEWAAWTVERQLEDVTSTLSLYRAALTLRADRPELRGDDLAWYTGPAGCLAFRRPAGLVCVLNTTGAPVDLPAGTVVLASTPLVAGRLPGNAAAWLI